METTPIATGLRGTASRAVTEELTAASLGSGDVPVLGTPAVLAVIEEAACAAIAGSLGPGRTSVGVWVEMEHLKPSGLGAVVEATAELIASDKRILEFTCEAREGDTLVARARHRRVVVDRERFLGSI
jgi:predicted thioesterase